MYSYYHPSTDISNPINESEMTGPRTLYGEEKQKDEAEIISESLEDTSSDHRRRSHSSSSSASSISSEPDEVVITKKKCRRCRKCNKKRCSKCKHRIRKHPRLHRLCCCLLILIIIGVIIGLLGALVFTTLFIRLPVSHYATIVLEDQAHAIDSCSGDFVVVFEGAPVEWDGSEEEYEVTEHDFEEMEDMLENYRLPDGYMHADQWELLAALDNAVSESRVLSVKLVAAPQKAQDHAMTYMLPVSNHQTLEEAVSMTSSNICVISPRYAMNSVALDVSHSSEPTQAVEVQRLPWVETHHAKIETAIKCHREFLRLDERGMDMKSFGKEFRKNLINHLKDEHEDLFEHED